MLLDSLSLLLLLQVTAARKLRYLFPDMVAGWQFLINSVHLPA
jgi:hypothetical protein